MDRLETPYVVSYNEKRPVREDDLTKDAKPKAALDSDYTPADRLSFFLYIPSGVR